MLSTNIKSTRCNNQLNNMNDLQKVLKLKTQQKLRKNNESKGQFVCAFIGSSYSHRTVYRSICPLFFIVMDV